MPSVREESLCRITTTLDEAARVVLGLSTARSSLHDKTHLVTDADVLLNRLIRLRLQRKGDGWLSEESPDDFERLKKKRVWIVDPIDGTREFVSHIPEWCISIALVENGYITAAGVCSPLTNETFTGASDVGAFYNGQRVQASKRLRLNGAIVLASRTEVERGEWARFRECSFQVVPMGSIALKLARVAAGVADATWTLNPKNEWDIAAGSALVEWAGGACLSMSGSRLTFNHRETLLPGLFACGPFLRQEVAALLI